MTGVDFGAFRASGTRSRALPEAEYVVDPKRLEAVRARASLLRWLRTFCEERAFLEVQTPLLRVAGEAANVHQYRLEAIGGRTFFLRTDPEEYLKRYLTAGCDAVYELSLNVRGEAPDANRLHEFTSLECYRRLATLGDMISLCHEMVGGALRALRGSLVTRLHGGIVRWDVTPRVCTFRELIETHAQIRIDEYPTAASLGECVRSRKLWQGYGDERDRLRGSWLERLLEACVLPALEAPTYIVDFPSELGLSARPRQEDPRVSLRAELYFPGGWELAHLYENLTEAGPLRERLAERRRRRVVNGYPDVALDEGLLGSAELGMPPMAGLAIGVDRLLMVVLGEGRVGQGLLFAREGFEESLP